MSEKKKKTDRFEDQLTKLEEIVDRLEDESVGLEEALGLFENGMDLARRCRARLAEVERKKKLEVERKRKEEQKRVAALEAEKKRKQEAEKKRMAEEAEKKRLAEDFERTEVTIDGKTKPVWRSGAGPGVIIMHEVPGITPEVARFARMVRDRGFTVFLPEMFGTVDRAVSGGYAISSMLHCCISREFHVLALGGSSPITNWLRKLCRLVHEEIGGPGVGAVGMCFSGGFALGMMVDDIMVAPVLSQPSFPIPRGRGEASGNLGLSPDDEAAVIERAEHGCQVLGLRFTDDQFVGTRFDGHLRDRALRRR